LSQGDHKDQVLDLECFCLYSLVYCFIAFATYTGSSVFTIYIVHRWHDIVLFVLKVVKYR